MLVNSSCTTRLLDAHSFFNSSVKFDLPLSEDHKKIISRLKQSFEGTMEATTIDQLFPDVLEEIFSHLNGSDLKNCALVCKDWDDVIGSYATTMKKLKIIFCLDRDDISIGCGSWGNREGIKIQSCDESYRKHRKVEILIRGGSLTQLPSLDRFNVSQVRSLILRFMLNGSIELNKVVKLLSRMPMLQMLTLYFNDKNTLDTSNAQIEHFTELKQLNVQASFSNQLITAIFEFIKADNLTELTYHHPAKNSDAEIDALADFIRSKKSLVKLAVPEGVITQLHQRHDFSGMSLESLKVNVFDNSGIVLENFRKSLISNAHSLTSLLIPSSLISREVLVEIFNRLGKLTMLEISTFFNSDDSWMDDLSPNDIIHDLSLQTLDVKRVGATNGLKTILQRAPQLKKLSLGLATHDIMKEVATSAPRLVQLEIRDFMETLTCDQRFNKLKSLKIDRIFNVDALVSLLERCPKIEVFQCFAYRNEDQNSIIDTLQQQKSLKHLRFVCCMPERSRIIFDKFKTNYGNLKSLKLFDNLKFISFDFPENPAEWNVAQQEARFSEFEVAHPDPTQ